VGDEIHHKLTKEEDSYSFKYHSWHKAVKKLNYTRRNQESSWSQGGGPWHYDQRDRDAFFWWKGGTFSHTQLNVCAGYY